MSSIVESLYNKYLVEDFNSDGDYCYLPVQVKMNLGQRELQSSNDLDTIENIIGDLSDYMESNGIANDPSISLDGSNRDSDISLSKKGMNVYEFILRIPIDYIINSFRPDIYTNDERLYSIEPLSASREI